MEENNMENDIFTLTDEEGNDIDFKVIADHEMDGQIYYAMIPLEDEDKDEDVCEYVILKEAEENGERIFITVDDDRELDKISDYFDDLFAQEVDYD